MGSLPLEVARFEVSPVALDEVAALGDLQLRLAGRVRHDRRLDHLLGNRLHQWIVADRLDENGAVVVPGRRGKVELEGKAAVPAFQLGVQGLDLAKPLGVAPHVVRLVVDHDEVRHGAHDDAEIDLAVGRLADRLWPEEEIREVLGVAAPRRLAHAMNVGEEQVAGRGDAAEVVLDVHRELEVVAPGAAMPASLRHHRIGAEDPAAVEIHSESVEHDDVGRD